MDPQRAELMQQAIEFLADPQVRLGRRLQYSSDYLPPLSDKIIDSRPTRPIPGVQRTHK